MASKTMRKCFDFSTSTLCSLENPSNRRLTISCSRGLLAHTKQTAKSRNNHSRTPQFFTGQDKWRSSAAGGSFPTFGNVKWGEIRAFRGAGSGSLSQRSLPWARKRMPESRKNGGKEGMNCHRHNPGHSGSRNANKQWNRMDCSPVDHLVKFDARLGPMNARSRSKTLEIISRFSLENTPLFGRQNDDVAIQSSRNDGSLPHLGSFYRLDTIEDAS